MRRSTLFTIALGLIAYGYGVYSHAYRTFPIESIGAAYRLVFPDRGVPVPAGGLFVDSSGREEIDCRTIRKDAAILLIMGQSNAANSGEGLYRPIHDVINLNWADGKCYVAEDPLLGTDGDGGTIWTRLADELIENAGVRQVVLVDIAASGTRVRVWAGDAGPARRAIEAAEILRRHDLRFTHVLWHQGESDWVTPHGVYIRLFREMTEYLRANGIDAPIFVATSTLCKGRHAPEIRRAQYELPTLLDNVFAGADADQVDRLRDRQDDLCHFKASGLAQLARLWRQALVRRQHVMSDSKSRGSSDLEP